jgi:tRNA wybutosine-synthesizing protein 3
MVFDTFNRRKKNQLEKADKSLKQSWDKPILELCNKINKLDDYYTTSSCSGRILLIIDSKEKRDDLFVFVSHNIITLSELKKAIEAANKTKKLIYFKQDPCILHVATRTLEHAQKIHDLAKLAGWKRCGIIASKDRYVVELNATERLEFPIMNNGEVLVDDKFLSLIVSEANKKLKSSWEKIDKLDSMINMVK